MNKFLFKSTDADFKKMFSIIARIDKNVLYTTYRMDLVNKWIHQQEVNSGTQKQVDDFYETSPQTESVVHPEDQNDLD